MLPLQIPTEQDEELTRTMAVFQQQCEGLLKGADFFLNIIAKNQATADRVVALRKSLAERYSEDRIANLFPKTATQVFIEEGQDVLLSWKTMGMAEAEALHDLNLRFMAYFSNSFGKAIGLPTVPITAPDGTQVQIVPLLFDYPMLKQALLASLFPSFLDAMIKERQEKSIKVAHLPSEAMLIPGSKR